MSSRKGSSKRNSSSHSSSGDSSANEVIAPKEEFEVEEEAKDAYYKALCGSPPPSQDIPIPKRPMRSRRKREPVLVMKVPESRTERWTSLRARSGSPCPGSSTLNFEDYWDYFP